MVYDVRGTPQKNYSLLVSSEPRIIMNTKLVQVRFWSCSNIRQSLKQLPISSRNVFSLAWDPAGSRREHLWIQLPQSQHTARYKHQHRAPSPQPHKIKGFHLEQILITHPKTHPISTDKADIGVARFLRVPLWWIKTTLIWKQMQH